MTDVVVRDRLYEQQRRRISVSDLIYDRLNDGHDDDTEGHVRNVARAIANLVEHLCDEGLLSQEKALSLCPGYSKLDVLDPDPPKASRIDQTVESILTGVVDLSGRAKIFSQWMVRDLLDMTPEGIDGFGPVSRAKLAGELATAGLWFGMSVGQLAFLERSINDLHLSVRLANALERAIIRDEKCVLDMMLLSEEELQDALRGTRHTLRRAVREINEILAPHGLALWHVGPR